MKIYNTLTHKVEDFNPINEGEVRIYSCGPTVYDQAHIGNLSSYIYADTLRRALTASGYKVKHVMNYTDVDDKTIKRSQERYPNLDPMEALNKLTSEYTDQFKKDMGLIGVDTNKIEFVRATDSIEDMKRLIAKLHKSGVAYVTEDGVYFSIDAYKKNGKTYGQLLNISAANTSEARIDNDEYDKESIHDFALWKKQKGSEPAWDFEIDGVNLKGRPGWHIECSAMSEAALGLPFDIHTGGIDLIFPHHENEIAQSTAANDSNVMAKYFVHSNHLLVDGKKMAKSANNFYTLQDIIDKGYDPLAFRLLVLQSHYRKESNFTWENLENAQNLLNNYRAMADLRWQPVGLASRGTTKYINDADELNSHIEEDLSTSLALSILSGIESTTDYVPKSDTSEFNRLLRNIDYVLGLSLLETKDIDEEQKHLANERENARKTKDWGKSDKLRDELLSQGIGLRDTDHGPIWFRV